MVEVTHGSPLTCMCTCVYGHSHWRAGMCTWECTLTHRNTYIKIHTFTYIHNFFQIRQSNMLPVKWDPCSQRNKDEFSETRALGSIKLSVNKMKLSIINNQKKKKVNLNLPFERVSPHTCSEQRNKKKVIEHIQTHFQFPKESKQGTFRVHGCFSAFNR